MWWRMCLRGLGMFLCFIAYVEQLIAMVSWSYSAVQAHWVAEGLSNGAATSIAVLWCFLIVVVCIGALELALGGPIDRE